MTVNIEYKRTLKLLIISLLLIIFVLNSIILSIPDEHDKHSIAIIALNVTAAIASSLGIIAVYRHGIGGKHGKSYLFLTIGLSLWFCADLNILYSHFVFGTDEQERITILDGFWLSGYVFLALHLVLVIKTIGIRNLSKTLSTIMIIIIGFTIINFVAIHSIGPTTDNTDLDTTRKTHGISELIVTILYPILDLSLIIPSAVILLNLYKDYQQSVPWVLASLSLLVNAIADIGYTNDFVKGYPGPLPWDLFYISDFIIMAGALFWYNKFHIQEFRQKREMKNSKG